MKDRLVEVRVKGLRTLEEVRLPLSSQGPMVLIGRNSTGKSSLLEACELLRRLTSPNFLEEFNHIHGGLASLLRFGAPRLQLGVRIQDEARTLDYDVALAREGDRVVIEQEHLHRGQDSIFERTRASVSLLGDSPLPPAAQREIRGDQLLLHVLQGIPPALFAHLPKERLPWLSEVQALREVLATIDVFPPFDVTPLWACRAAGRPSVLRQSALIEPAERLGLFGQNLANVFQALKNDHDEPHWQETMEYVRLGLGDEVESVNTRPDPGGGTVALRLKYRFAAQQVPAYALSDGTLAYLAFIGMCRLPARRSLLLIDEPEAHLHPQLLVRLYHLLTESLAPVVMATHSAHLLDALQHPEHSALLCQLDERGATQLFQPDADALRSWLTRYRGLGELRTEGHEASVMTRPVC